MKLHLFFVFFLALPLVGRLLTSDSGASAEPCTASHETTPAPTPTPSSKSTPAPENSAMKPATSATSPIGAASPDDRQVRAARALNFM